MILRSCMLSFEAKKIGESVSYLKDKDIRRNLSSTTIRGVHSILKTALSKAVDWQLITVNPAPRKGPRKCKPEFPIWTAAQIRLALENMDHELLHLVIHLAFLTSARVGEICGLTYNLDCYYYREDIATPRDYGEMLVDEGYLGEIPDSLINYLMDSCASITGHGLIERIDEMNEAYSGYKDTPSPEEMDQKIELLEDSENVL